MGVKLWTTYIHFNYDWIINTMHIIDSVKKIKNNQKCTQEASDSLHKFLIKCLHLILFFSLTFIDISRLIK